MTVSTFTQILYCTIYRYLYFEHFHFSDTLHFHVTFRRETLSFLLHCIYFSGPQGQGSREAQIRQMRKAPCVCVCRCGSPPHLLAFILSTLCWKASGFQTPAPDCFMSHNHWPTWCYWVSCGFAFSDYWLTACFFLRCSVSTLGPPRHSASTLQPRSSGHNLHVSTTVTLHAPLLYLATKDHCQPHLPYPFA